MISYKSKQKIINKMDLSSVEIYKIIEVFSTKNSVDLMSLFKDKTKIATCRGKVFFRDENEEIGKELKTTDLFCFVKEKVKKLRDFYISKIEKEEAKVNFAHNFNKNFGTDFFIRTVCQNLENLYEVEPNYINNISKLNTTEGVLDFSTGCMSKKTLGFFSYKLPINLNIDKINNVKKIFLPLFNNCSETFDFFIYYFTSGFIHSNPISYFLILFGEGGEGKSKFYTTLKRAFPYYTSSVENLSIQTKEATYVSPLISELKNKKIILINEMKTDVNTKLLKTITGKDDYSSRQLFSNEIQNATFHGGIIAMTNEKPQFDLVNFALKRRVFIFQYKTYYGPEHESYLKEIEKEEFLESVRGLILRKF